MKRTTVKLTDEVDARLRQEAVRRHITVSELTREAIEAHLGSGARREIFGGQVWHSGHRDTSERVEEILAEEWTR